MIFYKACNPVDIKNKNNYIPGTVTKDFKIAYIWYERYKSKKNKGACKHIKTCKKPVIIKFQYDENLLKDESYFQKENISEHRRENCWTSKNKDKAQINSIVNFEIVYEYEIDKLFIFN